jgi:eukaryotic-like serine/threonine-protein kinase
MRRVPAGPIRFLNAGVPVDEFLIDQFEVTNRQFKQFVDRGGYRNTEYWREPFVLDGRRIRWDEAMVAFRDKTGHPGPAGWVAGTYPEGEADLPVTGVSWFEAAAYARFAGKRLPTAFHWGRAAGFFSPVVDIVGASNFGGKGPGAPGTYAGLGPFGTYDMAGNVKEWIENAAGGSRLTLGGAWNEEGYLFWSPDPHAPFERAPHIGFRCVMYTQQPALALTSPIPPQNLSSPNLAAEKPVGNATFEVYRGMYRYDRRPFNASVDSTEDIPLWRKESVAFDAGYGNERVRAYLFLPRNVPAPYQVVVGFPPGGAFAMRSSRELSLRWAAFIVQSGRAFLYPVYKGTYERGPSTLDVGPNAARDEVIAWSRDVSRAIDYLQTRADIDSSRIGYYGTSSGADAGLIAVALEPRVKAAVLQGGGRVNGEAQLPEANLVNFVPRIRTPTLLLYGRNDIGRPVDTFQAPLFRLLGTPAEHKRHAILDGGHTPTRQQDVIREVLQWFDRYLGPVPSQ